MARQEELYADTIVGMKRALTRDDDDDLSEGPILRPTNRGNKLKRRARLIYRGKLDSNNGVRAYSKKIIYGDFARNVISRKPHRVDLDGDVIEDADDIPSSDLTDAEEDPYRDVRIESMQLLNPQLMPDILMPLTSAAGLKEHPTLSLPYTTKALDVLVRQAREMVQREQSALWRLKEVFAGFGGDTAWAPVGVFQSETDYALMQPNLDVSAAPSIETASDIGSLDIMAFDTQSGGNGDVAAAPVALPTQVVEHQQPEAQIIARDYGAMGASKPAESPLVGYEKVEKHVKSTETAVNDASETKIQGESRMDMDHQSNGAQGENGENPNVVSDDELANPQHRMTTRAKAQAVTSPSRDSTPASERMVHPLFINESLMPVSNAGLPYEEADETRRLLIAYIQKQEEVVRGTWDLYNGLLKAQRLRNNVFEWCIAEGHTGELEDGEDWCNFEQWGLNEGDLIKGKDEEEEEANVTGKKTRNRRAAAAV